MKTRHGVGLVGAALLTVVASDASADTPVTTAPVSRSAAVITAGDGNEGRIDGTEQRRGPGFEQTDVVTLNKDGKQYVVLVTMESVNDGTAPWQCACSSFEMQPDGPPKEIVHLQRLTNYKQDGRARVCNHPRMATDGDAIVWIYGSDYQANRPKTYAGAIDHQCRTLVNPILVSENPNENEGAPDIKHNGNSFFTAGYLSQGGNDTDTVYALGLQLAKQDVLYTLTKTWLKPVTQPSDIGRPAIQAIGPNRTLFCASKGENRPPEIGIECSILDTQGNIVWKNLIAPSYMDKDGTKHYMNQPTVAKLADNRYALNLIETNAMGQNTNLKGSNLGHLYTLDYAGDALVVNGHITGVAAHQTHSAICAGAFGVDGTPHIGVISAAPTGIGRPAMVMVDYDASTKQFTYNDDQHQWAIGWYGDSGLLANHYGENPYRQGRDFLRCIGDVPNPGYHVANGYMSDVKSFFVAPVSGRIPGDYKNSLFVSFVPGQVDTPSVAQNPVPADEVPPPATDNAPPAPAPQANSQSGCACSTPGTTDRGTTLGGLALFGLVALAVRRRRAS